MADGKGLPSGDEIRKWRQGSESDKKVGLKYTSDVAEPDVESTSAPKITRGGLKLLPVQRKDIRYITGNYIVKGGYQ